MMVDFHITDESTVAAISGVINTDTAAELQKELDKASRDKKLILDFKDVEYITSAGLRVLLVMRKRYAEDMLKLINVAEAVNDVFVVSGFDGIFDVKLAKKDMATYVKLSIKEFLQKKKKELPDRACFVVGSDDKHDMSSRIVYTWDKVDRLSQIIAKDLWDQGIRKGSHVGLMGANSANWLLTFFALQKLGALVFLVNFNLKATEVQGVSGIGDMTHLCYGDLTAMEDENEFIATVTNAKESTIRHTYSFASSIAYEDRLEEYPSLEGRFEEKVDTDDPAVVILTSGSTGKPKAVLLSAYNILNAAHVFAENFRLDSNDVSALILPLFHIFGLLFSFYGNVLVDGVLVIPKNNRTATILKTIEAEKCTQLYSVPTMLLAIAANKSFMAEQADSIKCVLMGGSHVTEAQVYHLQDCFRNAFFAEVYGLSEMPPVSLTAYRDTIEHVTKTVGKPIKNVEVCIEDVVTGVKLPQGQSGELLVKGFNSMVGYYRIALDDQPIDEDGWLHTGDLALIDEDGYIRLVGRKKELIIRGGENIAPGEIAEVITQFADVEDVKVQGVPDDFYGEVVGASIVMKNGITLNREALLAFLSGKLAKYKIPAFIFQYDQFPKLANGKVDSVGLKKDMNAKAAAVKKG